MDAEEFLKFILDKHHEGFLPGEDEELRGFSGEDEPLTLPNGCEWNDDVDK